jgi:hypothetical protein
MESPLQNVVGQSGTHRRGNSAMKASRRRLNSKSGHNQATLASDAPRRRSERNHNRHAAQDIAGKALPATPIQ